MKNRIRILLEKKGWQNVKPNPEYLLKLDISVIIWNKWLNNSVQESSQPNGRQLLILKDLLELESIEELIDVNERISISKKHRLTKIR